MARGDLSELNWYASKQPHLSLEAHIRRLEGYAHARREEQQTYLRLYSEREWVLANSMDLRSKMAERYRARKRARLSSNVVASCVDAWVNLLCGFRPHVTFMTKGADWGLQRKARKRTRFCEALFHSENFYRKASRVQKQAGIGGLGALHVLKEHGRVRYEYVQPEELLVDPREAMAGDVRSMMRIRTIDRNVACALFPEHERRIRNTQPDGTGCRLKFVDAWHLPSGPEEDDGFHVQAIPGVVTLKKSRYQWSDFPIVVSRFDDAPVGWDGVGIAERLMGIQYEINSVSRTIQANAWSGGGLKVAVPRGSNVSQSQLSNALGCPVIDFNGNVPPQFFAHDIASPQLFQYLAGLKQGAFDEVGISQMNATQSDPPASMSGKARLVHNQSYSRRFVVSQQGYEDFAQRVAEASLEAAADLAEDEVDLEVIFPGRDHLETIKYSDVAGERDEFDCQSWTAALAGETPAGRLASIEQMMGIGMIDLAGAMYLYEIPHDLRSHMETVLAPLELAREAIDRILEEDQAMVPTPMMDLQMAAKLSQMWFQRGMLRGVDQKRLYKVLDFNKMCLALMQKAQAAAMPGAAGAPPELAGKTLTAGPTQVQQPL